MANNNQILIYQNTDGKIKIETHFENETVWLTQKTMAELFSVGVPAISKHLSNIFESSELDEDSVISILETTESDGAIQGKTQESKVNLYNLDIVISVGYRTEKTILSNEDFERSLN